MWTFLNVIENGMAKFLLFFLNITCQNERDNCFRIHIVIGLLVGGSLIDVCRISSLSKHPVLVKFLIKSSFYWMKCSFINPNENIAV